ncbi:hypothetical protein VTN77DRAFT_3686 [Rasamsonia byssochlamydoides]|uniref:uncharacterized protein n=1 Tax=Rasamsonia byssochlamydoides TaxID=89139 RepID=UPI0037440CAA
MPCCGEREKIGNVRAEQKWDYINLDDFKSDSCVTGISYVTLWVFMFISIAVYCVDTFTAVNLLVFSRWSGQIKPSIPFSISRWIFAVCIIISFVLLFFRWLRTIRVLRSGSVAESYLDPLAVKVQSIRLGSGKGWKRFLVFAELTKSKKGADYVALFAYFSFESWLRVVFADGPRQVVNAITLYSVMQLNLIPEGKNAAPAGTSPIIQFFINVKALAEKNEQQAAILVGMLFTLIVWIVSALSLASSVILYLIFLWHHIPSQDGTLKRYCRRKINTRLERIVKRKVNKALAKGVVLQDRKPTQPNIAGENPKPRPLAPTLPDLESKMPNVSVSSLSRQPTQSSLPPYSSRPGSAAPDEKRGPLRQPTLPNLEDDRPGYSDSASLMGNAAVMGYSPLDRHPSPAPPMPSMPSNRPYNPVSRPPTAQSRSTPGPMDGPGRRTPGYGYAGPDQGYPQPPPSAMGRRTPAGPPGVQPPSRTYTPGNPPSRSLTPLETYVSEGSEMSINRSFTPVGSNEMPNNRSFTPADSNELPRQQGNGGYVAYANASGANDTPNNRSFTPVGSNEMSINRSFTPVGSNEMPNNRSFTPANSNEPPRPQGNGGYVAFNPSMTSPSNGEEESHTQTPTSPPYRNFARPSTTTPSNEGGYRALPANFSRPSPTSPSTSNEYGRPPPNRTFSPQNDPQSAPTNYEPYSSASANYEPYSYGSAI